MAVASGGDEGSKRLENCRPICFAAALYKWYERYLRQSLRMRLRCLRKWVVGFRAHKKPMDVVAYFEDLSSRASEWGPPAVVMSLDVATASDRLRSTHVAGQVHARGATAGHVAAVLRELVVARAKPCVGSIYGPWQELERGVRHCATRSPDLAQARAEVEAPMGPAIRWRAELSRWLILVRYVDSLRAAT